MSPIISVKDLKKYYQIHQKEPGIVGTIKSLFNRKYSDAKAVDQISFEIEEGELIGFIGPNGAGKTTTLKVLSGLLHPSSGDVEVLGYKPWIRNNTFLKQFALIMGQKNQLWWDLPAIETFLLNKEIYDVSNTDFEKRLKELSELLDVGAFLKVQVKKLSLGQRMKMELIAGLIHNPRLLFLDEPTIGLDVVMQKKMRDFIREINSLKKTTVILTSHYMQDVKELAKRVIIIDHGKILFDGDLATIIRKFAGNKVITIVLEKTVPESEFTKFGEIKSFEDLSISISVKRADAAHVTEALLKKFPIADLNIEEVGIEDVIREVFESKKS